MVTKRSEPKRSLGRNHLELSDDHYVGAYGSRAVTDLYALLVTEIGTHLRAASQQTSWCSLEVARSALHTYSHPHGHNQVT